MFMKKHFFLTTILLLGSLELAYAQGTFKVIASSGKEAPSKNGTALKIGGQIAPTDQIKVGAGSYLGLSYAKGGTVQISKAGTYSAKDLESKLLASTKTASQKYADFIIGEVVKGGDVNMHKNPHAYQNVTGSVERAISDMVVFLPNDTYFTQDNYTFKWYSVIKAKNYKIEFFDNFDTVLKTVQVQDTVYTINLNSPELKEADLIKIRVTPKEVKLTKIPEFSFNRDEAHHKKMMAKLEKLKKELGTDLETDATKQLELALFFEENRMLIDAKQAYEKASQLDPESATLAIALDQFMIRYGIGKIPAPAKSEE